MNPDTVLQIQKIQADLDNLRRTNYSAWLEVATRLAKIGMIAVIDEATAYQYEREANALIQEYNRLCKRGGKK